jgi:hypothetical protein
MSLLFIAAGFLGMLLLLISWFGGRMIESEPETSLDLILGMGDQPAIYDSQAPFIPIPRHLTTHTEMVAWMTGEMPKLVAHSLSSRS